MAENGIPVTIDMDETVEEHELKGQTAAVVAIDDMAEKPNNNAKVFVVEDLKTCDKQLDKELQEYKYQTVVLGLDCEWVSIPKAPSADSCAPACPVALLQLAFPNGSCFLVRLCKMDGKLPEKLKEILENEDIIKVGVEILGDAKRLESCYGISVKGCVDLRNVASKCQWYIEEAGETSNAIGLSALSQQILGITLNKDKNLCCDGWEDECLSEERKHYAAQDAIVAVNIFIVLAASKLKERDSGSTQSMLSEEDKRCNLSFQETSHNSNCVPSGFSNVGDSMFSTQEHLNGTRPDPESKAVFTRYLRLKVTDKLLSSDELWSCVLSLCDGIRDEKYKVDRKKGRGNKTKASVSSEDALMRRRKGLAIKLLRNDHPPNFPYKKLYSELENSLRPGLKLEDLLVNISTMNFHHGELDSSSTDMFRPVPEVTRSLSQKLGDEQEEVNNEPEEIETSHLRELDDNIRPPDIISL